MGNYDDYKAAVEALSGGLNTVVFDDLGMPSVMVPVVKQKYSDLITGGTQDTFPCFIIDGVEKDVINVSKFENIVVNGRAYSLPLKDPKVYISFDEALQACRNKGNGWGLMPGCLWQMLALWSRKNGTIPHGNTNYGCYGEAPFEKGVPKAKDTSGRVLRIGTGSGPETFYHNHKSSGIADLCGNIWEWTADSRLVNGEIQIIPYGNCMRLDCSMSATSTEWKAILPSGELVAPGTAGTLKYDNTKAGDGTQTNHSIGGPVFLSTTREHPMYTGGDTEAYYGYVANNPNMQGLTAKTGVNVPQILKAYGLFPVDEDLNGDGLYIRNYGERLPVRGGHWGDGVAAGEFALSLCDSRSRGNTGVGFRAAFVNL